MSGASILVTSAGGTVGALLLRMIAHAKTIDFAIVAADAMSDVGFLDEVSAFESLPMAKDPGYESALLEVIDRHAPDYILPLSEEECLVVSRLADEGRIPPVYLGTPHQTLSIITDKISCAEHLTARGIEVPPSLPIEDMADLEAKVSALGYPGRRVVVKPRLARGSRGFRVLDAGFDRVAEFYRRDAQIFVDLELLKSYFRDAPQRIREFFVMEFLPGGSVSVDIVAHQGVALAIFPHFRLGYEWGFVDLARIASDRVIEGYCREIVGALSLHGMCNIEVGYRDDGRISLIEVNGRTSATAAQNILVGANCIDILFEALAGRQTPFVCDRSATYRILSEYHRMEE